MYSRLLDALGAPLRMNPACPTSQDKADMVLVAPVEELADSWRHLRRDNPAKKPKPGLLGPEWITGFRSAFYDGHSSLLVRTALVRAENYEQGLVKAPTFGSPLDIIRLCAHLAEADHEYFVSLSCNSKLQVIAIHEACVGGTTSAAIEARQAVKVALLAGATGLVVVHNHPSGDPTPSDDDVKFTNALSKACGYLSIALLDHVIIAMGTRGKAEGFSFADSGLMP